MRLVLAACAPSGGGGSPTDQGPRTVQVEMTDELRYEPAEFTFQAGETVRFEVTNGGQIVHEFLTPGQAFVVEPAHVVDHLRYKRVLIKMGGSSGGESECCVAA